MKLLAQGDNGAIPGSRLTEVSHLVDVLTERHPSPHLFTTPGSKGYLSHLTTLPLEELLQEPTSLQTQSHHLTSSLTNLTLTSYSTFVSLHNTTTALTSSLESLASSLDTLLDTGIPALEESTGVWKGRTEAILHDRNKARVVLEQYEKIRDLLDIPVLIDTCVRNGHFGEALSLASHVATLASSFHKIDGKDKTTPSPAILTSVLSEVQHSITQMHLSLLETLYEPNRKLPALWKAANFLRKMDAFGSSNTALFSLEPHYTSSPLVHNVDEPAHARCEEPSGEEQLALAFLVGRESCLKAILESSAGDIQRLVKQVAAFETDDNIEEHSEIEKRIMKSKGKGKELDDREKEDLARYLKKYIDAWREGVYDIITQYSTIFLERSSAASASDTSNNLLDEEQFPRLHTLLRTYSMRALTSHLLATLKPSLPLLSLSHLPSLLTQLTYCSTAFARLGLDFRSTLLCGGGIFSCAILAIIERDFKRAIEKWIGKIEKARGTTNKNDIRTISSRRATAAPVELPSKWLILPSLLTSPPLPPHPPHQSSGPAHIPPQILASFPPIAKLTNAVLGVLNGLRLVVPRISHSGSITVNGNSSDVSGNADAQINTEGVDELLRVLDKTVLDPSAAALLDYLKVVVASLTCEEDVESEKEKEREREVRVVVAVGRSFFEIFGPFLRRALAEGVYGVKAHEEGWFKTEFEKLLETLTEDEADEERDSSREEEEEGSSEGER